jgi:MFS family permease
VPLLITWLDDSWRSASNVIGLSLLALSMGWLVLGRDGKHLDTTRHEPVQRVNPLAIVRRYKELWILAAGMFGNGVNFTGFSVFWPSFRIEQFDMSAFEVSVVMGIGGVFTSISGLTVGLIVSRRGWKRKVLIFSGIVLATTTLGMLWVGPIWALVLLFVVQSAGWTFFPSATTIPYELPGIKPRETVVAISTLFMSLWGGSFVGPIMSGLIQDFTGDLRLAIVVTSLGPLLMTIGALFLSKKWDLPPSYERTPPDTAKRVR